jgi:long-chain acyl-CoA synthetase
MNLAWLAERSVERFGEFEAVCFDGLWHTNTEQLAAAHRFANALVGLGVKPGDRVAVMMPNCLEVSQVYGAASAMGGVVVPIVFLLAEPEVRHILADCTPKVVVTSPDFYPAVQTAIEGLAEPPQVVVAGPTHPEGALSFEGLSSTWGADFSPVDRDEGDLAVIMYTGGTTGTPKGVMITHGNLVWMATTLADHADLGPEDVGLVALPVSHLFGMMSGITGQVMGIRGVLLRWFDVETVLAAIESYRVTYMPLVPTMALYLTQFPEVGRYDTSSLEAVLLSAAPVSLELKEGFAERFGCEVLEAYGQTEASPAIAMERRGEEKRPGSCGKAIQGVDVAILDIDGRSLATAEVGEICARSAGVMKGYFNLREASEEALAGGWLHTGDMGYMDADGYLYVTDRKKDLIIRGGFNVYPRDVEEVLYQHPSVGEAAVVGRPDPAMGEEVVAFVVRRPGTEVTEVELLEFCRKRLAKYKAPKEIRFVGYLPKSPIGKILKKELRTMIPSGGG